MDALIDLRPRFAFRVNALQCVALFVYFAAVTLALFICSRYSQNLIVERFLVGMLFS